METGRGAGQGNSGGGGGGDTDLPDGFLDDGEYGSTGGGGSQDDTDGAGVAPDPEPAEPSAERIEIHELSRKYVHPTYRVEFQVEAFASEPTDKALTGSLPWSFELDDVATRTYAFVIDPTHDVFRSTTMTALDALLTELSVQTLDFLKGQVHDVTLANILADYRSSYATATRLEPSEVISMANTGLEEFAKAVANLVPEGQGQTLNAELSKPEREHVARRLAARGVLDVPKVISDGRFWEYMDPQAVVATFSRHPELFFDGKYWLDPYETLDFGADHIDEEARRRLVTRYEAYLGDTLWLANQSSRDLETANRDEIIRATCSLRLMKPDVDFE